VDVKYLTLAAITLTVATVAAHSAQPKASPPTNRQPIEVKVISVPPAQPTEVKIISMPVAAPAEVKIVSTPPDESAHAMVRLTEWIVFANIVLCVVTVWSTLRQGRDQKRRDLAAMRREVRRLVANVSITATRLDQMSAEVSKARNHVLGGIPPTIKTETDEALATRRQRLKEIIDQSLEIVFGDGITKPSEADLTRHLWRLDAFQEQLNGMRDAITSEMKRISERF
jgi:hypothetical protein